MLNKNHQSRCTIFIHLVEQLSNGLHNPGFVTICCFLTFQLNIITKYLFSGTKAIFVDMCFQLRWQLLPLSNNLCCITKILISFLFRVNLPTKKTSQMALTTPLKHFMACFLGQIMEKQLSEFKQGHLYCNAALCASYMTSCFL